MTCELHVCTGVINHELGHNFGLYHASTSDVFSGAWSEYGDLADIMGGGGYPTQSGEKNNR